jgi:hypothetical protein
MHNIPFAELFKKMSSEDETSKDDLITVTATREQWMAVNKAIGIALMWSEKVKPPEKSPEEE